MRDASTELARLEEALETVRGVSPVEPRVGIVLGTGLGAVGAALEAAAEVPYQEIPGMPRPTVETHEGLLLLGRLEGVPVAVLQGRAHLYEGHHPWDIVFPIRLLRRLGAEVLVTTGICGGMNPLWELGDLVLLDDHLNLTGLNPLAGPNLDPLGPRFPDMSEPYDRELQRLALEAALELGLPLRRGVYAGVLGPSLETRAEYRWLRSLGADVVGMSTVMEVIGARHAGMRVLGLAVVSDLCLPDALEPVELEAILQVAGDAEPRMASLIQAVLARLSLPAEA